MLKDLCRALASEGLEVTVVGRDERKLAEATRGDARLHPLSIDYEDIEAFRAALDDAAAARGAIVLAICWVRSWAPDALRAASRAVAPGGRFVHVLGSQRSDASDAAIAELKGSTALVYQQVQLGAIPGRWLTNEEISAGVYAAVCADTPYYLVGTIAP
jgi:hypothetical protein